MPLGIKESNVYVQHHQRSHPSQRRYPPEILGRTVRMVDEALKESDRSRGVLTRWGVSWGPAQRPCANGSGKLRLTTACDRD